MIPGLDLYRVAAYGLAGLLLVGFGYYHGKQPYYELKAKVEAEGRSQQQRNEREAAARNAITDKREAEHASTIAALAADLDRLRNNPGGSLLPPAPAGAGRVDLVCFDREGLGQALWRYRESVVGLIAEGAEAAVSLETARKWWAEQGDIRP